MRSAIRESCPSRASGSPNRCRCTSRIPSNCRRGSGCHADGHRAPPACCCSDSPSGERRRLGGGDRGGRRCVAARAADRRDADARGAAHARRSWRFCTGCSTKTMCGCSSRRRCIFAAAARASASAACCRGWARRKRASVLAERGEVEVRCDFCNRAYVFDAVDVAQLVQCRRRERRRRPVH